MISWMRRLLFSHSDLSVMLIIMSVFFKLFFRHKGMLSGFLLLTNGCTPQLFWAKSDARPDEFKEDVRQSRQSLTSNHDDQGISETLSRVFKISEDAVGQCLMTKGWFLAENP